jgi:hypothetical protein
VTDAGTTRERDGARLEHWQSRPEPKSQHLRLRERSLVQKVGTIGRVFKALDGKKVAEAAIRGLSP